MRKFMEIQETRQEPQNTIIEEEEGKKEKGDQQIGRSPKESLRTFKKRDKNSENTTADLIEKEKNINRSVEHQQKVVG